MPHWLIHISYLNVKIIYTIYKPKRNIEQKMQNQQVFFNYSYYFEAAERKNNLPSFYRWQGFSSCYWFDQWLIADKNMDELYLCQSWQGHKTARHFIISFMLGLVICFLPLSWVRFKTKRQKYPPIFLLVCGIVPLTISVPVLLATPNMLCATHVYLPASDSLTFVILRVPSSEIVLLLKKKRYWMNHHLPFIRAIKKVTLRQLLWQNIKPYPAYIRHCEAHNLKKGSSVKLHSWMATAV